MARRWCVLGRGTIEGVVTIIEYLVIAAVVGAAVFFLMQAIFGRGERLAPLPARMSPSELPAGQIRGEDVRRVRFGLGLRGYRMSDVDWTLDRLADELDRLHAEVSRRQQLVPSPSEGNTAEQDRAEQ